MQKQDLTFLSIKSHVVDLLKLCYILDVVSIHNYAVAIIYSANDVLHEELCSYIRIQTHNIYHIAERGNNFVCFLASRSNDQRCTVSGLS